MQSFYYNRRIGIRMRTLMRSAIIGAIGCVCIPAYADDQDNKGLIVAQSTEVSCPKDDPNNDSRMTEMIKQGFGPLGFNPKIEINGIVYSNQEIDRKAGRIFLSSPEDNKYKIEAIELGKGQPKFRAIPKECTP